MSAVWPYCKTQPSLVIASMQLTWLYSQLYPTRWWKYFLAWFQHYSRMQSCLSWFGGFNFWRLYFLKTSILETTIFEDFNFHEFSFSRLQFLKTSSFELLSLQFLKTWNFEDFNFWRLQLLKTSVLNSSILKTLIWRLLLLQ